MTLKTVTLQGQRVRLEPLTHRHCDDLVEVIADGALDTLKVTIVPSARDVPHFVQDALDAHARGDELAFATIDLASGRLAGSTRFMRYHATFKRVEIGFTFLAKSYQRSHVNSEAKLLMLTHAIEVLGVNRVELITDVLNQTSRTAIERLGASQEGIMRQHMVMRDGRIRDSILYSIIAPEWPTLKQRLSQRLQATG
jgi:RimJ/RimL family protein N-acetyltransferase